MSKLREKRIKLLREVKEIVSKSVDNDRGMYDSGERREVRKADKMIREIEDWVKDLQKDAIVSDVQKKIDEANRRERKKYDDQRVSWYQ